MSDDGASHSARVLRIEDAGGGLSRLTLEVPPSVRTTYVRPGQFVSTRAATAGGRAAYFVLANEVGSEAWELLVRRGGEAADALLAMRVDDSIDVSSALGAGFPCEEVRRRPLLLLATGSGIAAMLPVAALRMREGDGALTEALLGVRSRAEVPLAMRLEEWSVAGVDLTICLSRENPPSGEGGFAKGYVQDVARRTAPSRRPGGMIFAAGVKAMVDAIRLLAAELGVAEADVRTNY